MRMNLSKSVCSLEPKPNMNIYKYLYHMSYATHLLNQSLQNFSILNNLESVNASVSMYNKNSKPSSSSNQSCLCLHHTNTPRKGMNSLLPTTYQ